MKFKLTVIALLMSSSVFAGNNNGPDFGGDSASSAVANARAQQSVKAEQNQGLNNSEVLPAYVMHRGSGCRSWLPRHFV